jgi:hypothetical protein
MPSPDTKPEEKPHPEPPSAANEPSVFLELQQKLQGSMIRRYPHETWRQARSLSYSMVPETCHPVGAKMKEQQAEISKLYGIPEEDIAALDMCMHQFMSDVKTYGTHLLRTALTAALAELIQEKERQQEAKESC